MYKITIYFIVCMFFYTYTFSQDTSKIISKYRIIESWHDGQVLSSFDQERKGELFIHYNQKNQLCLSNISMKSGSYSTGLLTQPKRDTAIINDNSLINSYYIWSYHNTYDKNKGVAKVHLTEEETNYGMTFKMVINLSKNSKIIYKGFKVSPSNMYIIPMTIF